MIARRLDDRLLSSLNVPIVINDDEYQRGIEAVQGKGSVISNYQSNQPPGSSPSKLGLESFRLEFLC